MSKYIIELGYDLQRVVGIGVKQGTAWVKDYDVDDLEELCADYINEHFSDLQDTAYQKGFEDGKAIHEKGCEGCEYTVMGSDTAICSKCCNAYHNQWKAKDDKIEVGDEVTDLQLGVNFVVTHLWKNNYGEMGVSGFNGDCSAFSATFNKVKKTGRHFDIASILEDMRCGQ